MSDHVAPAMISEIDNDVRAVSPAGVSSDIAQPIVSIRLVSSPSVVTAHPVKPLLGPFGAPKRPRIPRICHVKIARLEVLKPMHKSAQYVCISARIRGQKVKHTLFSTPIPIPPNTSEIPLDIWFSLSYLHRLKGDPSIAQIGLHKCKADGRNPNLLANADLPLDEILQYPLKGCIILEHQKIGSKADVAKVYVEVSTIFNDGTLTKTSDTALAEDIGLTGANLNQATDDGIDVDDDISCPSVASDNIGMTDEDSLDHDLPSVVGDHATKAQSSSYNANALLKLRPVLASKMKLVKQSGTRMFDRIRNLRRKSFSSSEDDEENVNSIHDVHRPGVNLYPDPSADTAESRGATIAEIAEDELHKMAYTHVAVQMDQLAAMVAECGWPKTVILVDRNARQAKQLLEWSSRSGKASVLAAQKLLFFGDCSEAEFSFNGIASLYKRNCQNGPSTPLRIAIAGDDTSLSMIVRPFVQLLATDPRGWADLRFHVIPLNRGTCPKDHVVAERVAAQDQQFRALFFSSSWEDALDGASSFIEPVGRQIEDAITRYMLGADGIFRLPIAEIMLEIDDADDPEMVGVERVSFPMIRDFSVLDIDDDKTVLVEQIPLQPAAAPSQSTLRSQQPGTVPSSPEHHLSHFGSISTFFPVARRKPIVIEYWSTIKKPAGSKVVKHTFKAGFASARVFRLSNAVDCPSKPTDGSADEAPPVEHTEEKQAEDSIQAQSGDLDQDQMLMIVRPLPKDKNKFLQRLGAYSPKRGTTSATVADKELRQQVCKFVCSAPSETRFSACIDGIVIPNIQFASLAPLWPTRTKFFPVAIFRT